MSFVRIIKVTGVSSHLHLWGLVHKQYPHARIQESHGASTVLIVVPDLSWPISPTGPEGFFRELCRSGVINGFHHKRYSDQEEVRF